jgi:hypothetical protein
MLRGLPFMNDEGSCCGHSSTTSSLPSVLVARPPVLELAPPPPNKSLRTPRVSLPPAHLLHAHA